MGALVVDTSLGRVDVVFRDYWFSSDICALRGREVAVDRRGKTRSRKASKQSKPSFNALSQSIGFFPATASNRNAIKPRAHTKRDLGSFCQIETPPGTKNKKEKFPKIFNTRLSAGSQTYALKEPGVHTCRDPVNSE